MGFGGVLLMMIPQFGGGADGLGWVVILPVLAAAGYASMSVLTRKLGATSRASALAIHIQLAFIIISSLMAVAYIWRVVEGACFSDEAPAPQTAARLSPALVIVLLIRRRHLERCMPSLRLRNGIEFLSSVPC